jgi:hypothetical protein
VSIDRIEYFLSTCKKDQLPQYSNASATKLNLGSEVRCTSRDGTTDCSASRSKAVGRIELAGIEVQLDGTVDDVLRQTLSSAKRQNNGRLVGSIFFGDQIHRDPAVFGSRTCRWSFDGCLVFSFPFGVFYAFILAKGVQLCDRFLLQYHIRFHIRSQREAGRW